VSALTGLRVAELAEGWAGPLAGRALAQLGADVVKVEPPAGDWLRGTWPARDAGADVVCSAFDLTCAGKRSLVLDHTRGTADADRLRAIVERADVIIVDAAWIRDDHSRAGSLAALAALAPAAIICSVTPFGREGALSHWCASDLTLQAVSGVMASTGYADDAPTRAGPTLADHASALHAAAAILAALEDRRHTGRGQQIDIAGYDCLVSYLFLFLSAWFVSGTVSPRQGNRHLTCAPWNAYPCADGWVQISTSTDLQWRTIAALAGATELGTDARFANTPARMRNIDAVDAIVTGWTRGRSVADVLDLLRVEGIPAARIATLDELLRDPQFLARGMLVRGAAADGAASATSGSIFKLSAAAAPTAPSAAPPLGAHTGEVLREYAALTPLAARTPVPGAGAPRTQALEGVVVVEVGAYGAGPLGTRFLAELGAEVIKVEPPDGDPIRHFLPNIHGVSYPYHFYNLNKRGVRLDLKSAQGRAQLRRLLARADIFLENLAPGTLEAWGLGPEALRRDFPQLVCCSVSGFGHSGPYRGLRAYDTTIQAMSAVMAMTGRPERGPTKVGLSIADLMGPTAACAAMLAALYERRATGRGQHVDIAMMDVMAWSTQSAWPAYFADGIVPTAIGNAHPALCPHDTYATRDGRVALAVERDAPWRALVAALGAALPLPAGLATPSRLAQRARIDALIGAWAAERDTADAVATLQAAGVPSAPVLEIGQAVVAAHTRERSLVVEVPDASGRPMRVIQSAFRLSRTPGRMHAGGPLPGQHDRLYLDPPPAADASASARAPSVVAAKEA
jgi:crotonobetainyl-CoA:carnitine CoA-transferase CaiB-like acyl-CoA transferase